MAVIPEGSRPEALGDLPYRDRQIVCVVHPERREVERREINIGDYYGRDVMARQLRNVRNWFTLSYYFDTRNWGLIGYWIDRWRAGGRPGEPGSSRSTLMVPADLAERALSFPPGHPHYDTAYAGHPLRPRVYVPMASFHRVLFEEKFNELLTLLSGLGATRVSMHCVRGYRESTKGHGGLGLPAGIDVDLSGSAGRKSSQNSEAALEARFVPVGTPHVPADGVWYPHEETWQRVANARLTAGLTEIDVDLKYDDDFGVDGDLAVKLQGFGVKLGGDYQRYEQTSWKFHASFT